MKALFWASVALLLHFVLFLFTGVALWSKLPDSGEGAIRFAGLAMIHFVAVAYVFTYLVESIE